MWRDSLVLLYVGAGGREQSELTGRGLVIVGAGGL